MPNPFKNISSSDRQSSQELEPEEWRVATPEGIVAKVGVVNQRDLKSLRIETIGVVGTHCLLL